jgi:hypothetical protein
MRGWVCGHVGCGGKLLPPAANAALNASPSVNARRARYNFTHPAFSEFADLWRPRIGGASKLPRRVADKQPRTIPEQIFCSWSKSGSNGISSSDGGLRRSTKPRSSRFDHGGANGLRPNSQNSFDDKGSHENPLRMKSGSEKSDREYAYSQPDQTEKQT